MKRYPLRFAFSILLLIVEAAHGSWLSDAAELQRQGKLKEARDLLRSSAGSFRKSGDKDDLVRAISGASRISLAMGDYPAAIAESSEAIQLRGAGMRDSRLGDDFNTGGLAHQYLGNYAAALENYRLALTADRAQKDEDGEITRLNNIGNISFFQGHYADALRSYQDALAKVNATASEPWNPWRRQLTIANLAALYQRLGKEEDALAWYQRLSSTSKAMPARERAQLLLNEGVLYRRMGDPIKALEMYRAAQALFATDRHSDGEIGALRNIGIARALDLNDLAGALDAFGTALKLAQMASNTRGEVQASLYRGEVLRRLQRLPQARSDLQNALAGARQAGLIEEQWKARYALGQNAEEAGQPGDALTEYQEAIAIIESVRAGLTSSSLKTEFLADKRDVYDRLIALRLASANPPPSEILRWMERGRARTLLDRMAARTPWREPTLAGIQSRLAPHTTLIEYWMGEKRGAAVWITSSGSGLVQYTQAEEIAADARTLERAIAASTDDWKGPSQALGAHVLAGIPLGSHVIIVPDGALNTIPFEALRVPGSGSLLIEKCDVSYLPSVQFLVARRQWSRWMFPWRRQLVALANPPVSSSDALAGQERWQQLPASAEEVQGIARELTGRAEIHVGTDARKTHLLDQRVAGVPLIHLGTHALVDAENPDRSRILLAPDSTAGFDYLFQEEVYDLNLKNVDLVTLSACNTARGKLVRGEGLQAFSQAFLAAGASATITTLWNVADEPTSSLMQQLYYFLGRGESKAAALRAAKLRFLESRSAVSAPRYWAGFVLNGNGWDASSRAVPWSLLLVAAAGLLAVAGIALRRLAAVRAARR